MRSHIYSSWGRRRLLGCSLLVLVVTAACSNLGVAGDTGLPEQVAKSGRAQAAVKRVPEEFRVELERLETARQKKETGKGGNAFGATSWYVPPPPPPPLKPLPPPPPTAPPMPFSYLGLYEGSDGKIIMLVRGDHIYTVGVGDVIDNTYRIDRFAHGMVEMTYLPLNIKQSINTGKGS